MLRPTAVRARLVGVAVVALLLASLAAISSAHGQGVRWVVDGKGSVAWWQVDPHMNHLWGTTCPGEPSWQAGEGRSAGWGATGPTASYIPGVYKSDTTHIPLYPRHRVRFVCPADAVQGTIVVADTVQWRNVRGQISVATAALVTGERMRDEFAQRAILESQQYPHADFKVDSLVGVTIHGDTIRAMAYGAVTLHGVSRPAVASLKAFHEAGGERVLARFHVPAEALPVDFNVSKYALGLGVGTHIWRDLYMGVDMLLRPETSNTSRGSN